MFTSRSISRRGPSSRRRDRLRAVETLEPRHLMAVEVLYFSADTPGTAIGSDGALVKFDDSDILRLDVERGDAGEVLSYRYQLLFDGSDVGLDTDAEDIDALAVLPDGRMLISTIGKVSVPGVTAVAQDVLLFTPAAGGYGSRTTGTWSLYFDGSDVGLTTSNENVDAVEVLPDGKLLISTTGVFSVPGARGGGEDLLLFTPAANGLGPQTVGGWSLAFDGSSRDLKTSNEKIDAMALDADGNFVLSTNGVFAVTGAAGADEDLIAFQPGTNTYAPGLRMDGSALGLAAAIDINALAIWTFDTPAPEATPYVPYVDLDAIFAAAASKLAAHDALQAVKTRYPNTAGATATTWGTTGASNWVSGFYPGSLWLMYEATGDPAWLERAVAWTAGIAGQQFNTGTHDVGFMVMNSFGQGERLTGDAAYRDVLLNAANSLSSRYSAKIGAIRSWNGSGYRVIIDNMMNLEILFRAAEYGGTTAGGGSSQQLYDMAVSHALKTLQNHVRADGSTYHLVNYSTSTGKAVSKQNAGGKSTETTWSRGQGWAVYGFTMTYRETGDETFLEAARRTADYYLANVPEDFVPAADFASPYTDLAHKDSSAAAITASALVELSTLETDPARRERYWQGATMILDALSSPPYLSSGPDHAGILLHGSRSYPGDDLSLVYGDYYLLEAALRYQQEAVARAGASST